MQKGKRDVRFNETVFWLSGQLDRCNGWRTKILKYLSVVWREPPICYQKRCYRVCVLSLYQGEMQWQLPLPIYTEVKKAECEKAGKVASFIYF